MSAKFKLNKIKKNAHMFRRKQICQHRDSINGRCGLFRVFNPLDWQTFTALALYKYHNPQRGSERHVWRELKLISVDFPFCGDMYFIKQYKIVLSYLILLRNHSLHKENSSLGFTKTVHQW